MSITGLSQWVGKHVRTEDDSMYNCGRRKLLDHLGAIHSISHRDSCSLSDKFGGEGWVVRFEIDNRGTVYLCTDEGIAWPITSNTVIVEVPSRYPMDEEAAETIRRSSM